MAKTRNKKFNQRKHIDKAYGGASLQASVWSRNVVNPMPDDLCMMQTARILSALDCHRPGTWDVNACRSMSHYYRVILFLARHMNLKRLDALAQQGQRALMRIINQPDDIPVVTERDYEDLRAMCYGIIDLIDQRRISYDSWAAAWAYTMDEFTGAIQEQFDGMPDNLRGKAIDVIAGEKVPDAAAELGVSEEVMAGAAVEVALIAHAILAESAVPLPNKIAIVRKVSSQLTGTIERLRAGEWRTG